MSRFNVLIVGAGNVGAFYDSPGDSKILTHAHAFSEHNGFRVAGFVDSSRQKCESAAATWGGKAFVSIKEAFDNYAIDVVTIAAPDEYHFPLLTEVSEYPVRAVLAEKPLSLTSQQAANVLSAFRKKNTPVWVNYSRRFVEDFETIRQDIATGVYGEFLSGSGFYGKGLLHNGSHMIDLLRFLIGEIARCTPGACVFDYTPSDPSASVCVDFERGGSFYLHAIDSRRLTIFEVDLLFSKKRIRIVDSGFTIEAFDVCDSPVFKGHKIYANRKLSETRMVSAMSNLVENIYDNLTKGTTIKCSAEDGLRAVQVCTGHTNKELPA